MISNLEIRIYVAFFTVLISVIKGYQFYKEGKF